MSFDYITDRLDVQLKYYDTKAVALRKEYYVLSIIVISLNAIIPVLSIGIDAGGVVKYFIAVISSLASVLSGVLLIRRTKEIWVAYRNTHDALLKEKTLYITSSGKYSGETTEDFILNCEEIMRNEHELWNELNQRNTEERRK